MTFLIESKNIVVARPSTPALRFPDCRVGKGRKLLLIGPSGSGKTTLLLVLAGLLKPDEGYVTVEGRDLYCMSAAERDRFRGRFFGFVFQTLHLIPSLTLRQNIALAGTLSGKGDAQRIEPLLQQLGLADKAHRKPHALSFGEQQRGGIARAVLHRPALILADEPTSALDDANAEAVMDLLELQAQETDAALIVATHDYRIRRRFESVIELQGERERP